MHNSFVDGFCLKLEGILQPCDIKQVANMLDIYTMNYDIKPLSTELSVSEYKLPEAYYVFMAAKEQDGQLSETSKVQYRMCIEKLLFRFTIPHPMPIASDSMPSITVTSCKANIRQNGNYLAESSTELVGASGYVISATASQFGINVVVTKSSAFANAVNNESCGVSATVTLRFT